MSSTIYQSYIDGFISRVTANNLFWRNQNVSDLRFLRVDVGNRFHMWANIYIAVTWVIKWFRLQNPSPISIYLWLFIAASFFDSCQINRQKFENLKKPSIQWPEYQVSPDRQSSAKSTRLKSPTIIISLFKIFKRLSLETFQPINLLKICLHSFKKIMNPIFYFWKGFKGTKTYNKSLIFNS